MWKNFSPFPFSEGDVNSLVMDGETIATAQMITVRWWNASAYYAVSLAHSLQKQGVPSLVVGWKHHPPLQKAREWHLPTLDSVHLSRFTPWTFVKNLRQLRNVFQQHHITIVNAHRPEDHLYAGLLRRYGLPHIRMVRTISDVRAPKNNPVNFWLHNSATDFFIFSCRASLERYQQVWPIFTERSAVIYSAVDVQEFHPQAGSQELRQQLHPTGKEIVVGIVGRLSPIKGHRTFLQAAAKVQARAPQTRFLVSGEAVEISHSQLQQFAREVGVGAVTTFMDRQPDVRDVIQAIDIGVVASKDSEVVGRVAVEFMAMGRPLVVTQINVLPEIVWDGENGFVVPSEKPEAMAQKILTLVEQPQLRQKMGRQARQMAEKHFSLDVFAHQTLKIYRQLQHNLVST